MTKEEKIIELLRDDQEYYNGIGNNYMSNSDISTLFENPMNFKKPRPDNPNFAVGRYFHQSILEPEKAKDVVWVDASTRNTKVYKEFCAEQGIEVSLLLSEKERVEMLVKKMKGNLDFFDMIYKEGNVFEQPGIKEIFGVEFKGKADILSDDTIYDLKTTSDLSKFRWSVTKYNYDSQAFIYKEIFGKDLEFLVIEKQTGALGYFPVSHTTLLRGEQKVEAAVEIYNQFYGPNPTESFDQYYRFEEV